MTIVTTQSQSLQQIEKKNENENEAATTTTNNKTMNGNNINNNTATNNNNNKQQQQQQQNNHHHKKKEYDLKKFPVPEPFKNTDTSILNYYLGMFIASCFSLIYFIAPFYMISGLWLFIIGYPTRTKAFVYNIPIIISAILPSKQVPWLLCKLKPICTYFNYEEILETKPIHVAYELMYNQKNYLFVFQPHGAISYGGICSACCGRISDMTDIFPTAVADALLYTPILKHVLGIFGLISASKQSLIRTLQKPGAYGSIVLYVGGLAELFLSSETEEILYLNKRKGFIKLALQQGVDIVPIYLFGNTSALSVLKTGILATLSRKLQVSLTYIWGKYYLPIPRDCKLLYVTGQPLGIDKKIPNPTNDEIDYWHSRYCQEVTRIFETYKERVPEYKHKKLIIV